jgi:predicted alternative tryptophan synthase beta-subunit
MILVTTRPWDLPRRPRPVVELSEILPTGLRRALLRAAAWIDLPISVRPGVYRMGRPEPLDFDNWRGGVP